MASSKHAGTTKESASRTMTTKRTATASEGEDVGAPRRRAEEEQARSEYAYANNEAETRQEEAQQQYHEMLVAAKAEKGWSYTA